MSFAPQRRALFRHPNLQKWREHVVFCTFWLGNVLRATTACTFQHPNLKKWREHVVFCTFWLGNVLRATTACTFSTSEPPKVARTCGVLHFDFEMRFAPQRRALFRHLNCQKWSGAGVFCTFLTSNVLRATTACTFSTSQLNFQKWSEPGVFCTFWLGNVLRATTACTFSTSQLPKVVRQWCALYILTSKCASCHNGVQLFAISTSKKWSGPGALYILTWKCASRHNGVQLFISHLASWLRTRRFSEPTFRASGATNHWKNTVFRDFPTFSRICIFFLLTLSLLWSSLF